MVRRLLESAVRWCVCALLEAIPISPFRPEEILSRVFDVKFFKKKISIRQKAEVGGSGGRNVDEIRKAYRFVCSQLEHKS